MTITMKTVRVLKTKRLSRRRTILLTSFVTLILVFSVIYLLPSTVKAQDDYTFGTEQVNKGASISPTERNTENAVYNQLQEADQYTDTNFSGSSENMVLGTTAGGAFPSALDTDDATRRNYIEANTAVSNYVVALMPTSDSSVNWDTVFPASPTTHYDKLDESTYDSDTTYVTTATSADRDVFGMADVSTPSGTPAYDIQVWAWAKKANGGSMNLQFGMVSGGTDYSAYSGTLTTSYLNYSAGWITNPKTSAEWTLAEINALTTYMTTNDIAPVPYVTQLGILVYVNYTTSYQLDAQITYSGVTSTSQTTGFQVFCQGYRNGDTENVNVQAWNYTSAAWVTKVTISAASDTDYNFNLLGWAGNCERSSGNVVLLRLVDASGADATQTTVYLDLLKVNRIEQGYALDVELTSTTVAQYGNITLRIKTYTSAEPFSVSIYNYTAAGYDSNWMSITSLSNTWQTTLNLNDTHHRSGTNVKIQIVDTIAQTADTTLDILYLDVAWVTRYHTDPSATLYGADPPATNLGNAVVFFLNYTDYDNEAPTTAYPKVHIDSTDYSMTKNTSGDTSYYNGCNYSYSKSDLTAGSHTYYFIVKDDSSTEVTTGSSSVTIHQSPTLSGNNVNPATGNNGDTFSFYVTYNDADGDLPTYMKAHIDTTDYDMTKNDSGDFTPPIAYYYQKAMSGGAHTYYFKTMDAYSPEVTTTTQNLNVNNPPTINSFGRAPADPVYPTTLLNFTVTFTDLDGDLPSAMKWREGGGATQNLTMAEVQPWDTDTTNGKLYYKELYLSHGSHDYDFYAADGMSKVSGGSNSVTIQNRNPTIDNGPGAHVDQYRNQAWYYDFDATDLDGDTVGWQLTGAAWLTVNPSSGYVSGTTTDTPGTYPFTVYANDSYGGSANYPFELHITNRVPQITNGPGAHVDQWRNQAWYYNFDYSDADGDSVSWQRSGPSWLTIASDGNLTGTTSDTPGLYSFVIYCNDSYGGSANYPFDIHIENRAPDITNGPGASVNEWRNTAWQYDFDYSDADGDSVSWGRSGADWLSINSNGLLSGTTTNTPGDYAITVYCNDSYSGQDTYAFTLHILNRAPTITDVCAANPTAYRNVAWSFDFNATDADTDTIIWARTGASWLTIDSGTGILSGTTSNTPGDYQYTVYANDSYSGSDSYTFTLTVQNRNPSITDTCGSNPTAYRSVSWSFDFNATDPDTDTLIWARTGAAWLTIDSGTGVLSGTTSNTPGDYVFTVYANDSYGGSDSFGFTLTLTNRAPSITDKCSANPTAYRNAAWSFDFNATDPDSDTLIWARTGYAWLTIDSGTGVLSGTTTNTPGDYIFTVYANDSYGGSSNYQFTLTIVNRAPEITNGPTEPSAYRNVLYWYVFTYSDADGDSVTWQKSGPSWLNIDSGGNLSGTTTNTPGSYSVTVWANDSYGGSDSHSFTLYIVNRNPEITSNPGDPSTWRNTFWWWDFTATDPDTDSISWAKTGPAWLTISGTGNLSGTAPDAPGDYGFVVYANDSYGGTTNYPFTLHVVNAGLTITNGPGSDPATYRNTFWWYDFDATDDPIWAYQGPAWLSINPSTGNLSGTTDNNVGTYLIHVWANDTYGASDEYNFTLHVNNRAPSITDYCSNPSNAYRNVPWSFDFNYSDPDGDSVSWQTNGAGWLTIDANGILSGTTTNTPGSYALNVWANDSYSGSANYQFTLNINNRAPVITSWGNTTQQSGTYMAYLVTGADDDGDSLTLGFWSNATWLSKDGFWINGTATGIGWYVCNIWVNDSYGGSDFDSWQVTVWSAENQPPSFTSAPKDSVEHPVNFYYDCNASDPESDPLVFAMTSTHPNLGIDASTGEVTGYIATAGIWWVNISVSDATHTVWQNFSLVASNTVPSFTSSPKDSVGHPVDYYYDCNATDADGDSLVFALQTSCGYLGINPTTGIVSGYIPIAGTWSLNISVSDPNSTVWQNFSLTASNTPPAFDTTPTESWQHGTTYTYDANAHDDNGDSYSFGLAGNSTSFLTIIPSTGVVTGIVPTVGWWYLNVSVSDSNSTTWQYYILTGLNTAPSFTSSGITEWQNGTEYIYDANANDVNLDSLTWYLEGNGTVYFEINPTTGVVNGTIHQMGWWYVNISVGDSRSTSWQNFTVVALNTAPSFTTSPVLTLTLGSPYYYNSDCTDINGDTISFELVDDPPVWAFVDWVTGECEGTPVLEGNYDIHLRVFDGLAYSWQNWTLSVSVYTEPEPEPEPEPVNPSTSPMAKFSYLVQKDKIAVSDESKGNIVKWQWSFGDGFGDTGKQVIHQYASPGQYIVKLTVTDNLGGVSTAEVVVTIGAGPDYAFQKGESGFLFVTPVGSFEWNATLSVMLGIVAAIISFSNKKIPILSPRRLKIVATVCLLLGLGFYLA
jgi:hypothetical protein